MKGFLDEEEKWAVVILKKYAGWRNVDIQKATGLSASNVTKVWAKYMDFGDVDNHYEKVGGHNKKVNNDLRLHIENAIRNNRYITSHEIARSIYHDLDTEVSDRLVRDVRHEMGFRGVKPIYTPHLTPQHEAIRREYCHTHREDKFRNVMFLDECGVRMKDKGAIVWYRPDLEEKPQHEYGDPYSSVMVGAGISYRGKTNLYFYEENINRHTYKEFLQDAVVPRGDSLLGDRWRVLQDNARPHIGDVVRDYYDEVGLHVIEWPARSPDLNPIELVWGHMKNEVKKEILEEADLEDALIEAWDNITNDIIEAYIDELPHRIQVVYANNGRF